MPEMWRGGHATALVNFLQPDERHRKLRGWGLRIHLRLIDESRGLLWNGTSRVEDTERTFESHIVEEGSSMSVSNTVKVAPLEVTDATFSQEVLHSTEAVLLDCWAPWCGPCRMMAPVMDELAVELAGVVKVAKLNVDQNPQAARALNIQSIPTLLLFRSGEVIKDMMGAAPKETVRKAVTQRLRER